MPTKLKSRGNCWLARVVIDGQQVDSKVFPPGRSKGPEWMAAKTWEVERKKEFLELRERTGGKCPSVQPQEAALQNISHDI